MPRAATPSPAAAQTAGQRARPNAIGRRRVGYGGGGGGGSRGPREMFTATCSSCGNEAQVPFQPSGDKPVYCSTCFQQRGGGSRGGGGYGAGRSGGRGRD